MASRTRNYIPRPDGDFSAWVAQYFEQVSLYYEQHWLDPGLLTPLKHAVDAWSEAYPAHVAAQAAAEGARQAKDAARAELERQVRPVTNFIQGSLATTDADRATIGITVRAPGKAKSPTPTTRPLVSAAAAGRLTHQLRLVDEHSPTRTGKPRGVSGAEVWVTLVDPGQSIPTDPATLAFLTTTTRPTLRTDFPAAAGGKTAVYMLRWVNTRGEKGPWSEAATATVAA